MERGKEMTIIYPSCEPYEIPNWLYFILFEHPMIMFTLIVLSALIFVYFILPSLLQNSNDREVY
jgi:hypothetical protein